MKDLENRQVHQESGCFQFWLVASASPDLVTGHQWGSSSETNLGDRFW